jgi:hypothetical protein
LSDDWVEQTGPAAAGRPKVLQNVGRCLAEAQSAPDGDLLLVTVFAPAAEHFGTLLPPFGPETGIVPLGLLDLPDQFSLAEPADADQPDLSGSLANFHHIHTGPPGA